jgi:hypothetical protein
VYFRPARHNPMRSHGHGGNFDYNSGSTVQGQVYLTVASGTTISVSEKLFDGGPSGACMADAAFRLISQETEDRSTVSLLWHKKKVGFTPTRPS